MTNLCKKNIKWLDYPENKPRKTGYYFVYAFSEDLNKFYNAGCYYNKKHGWYPIAPVNAKFTVLGFINGVYAKYSDDFDFNDPVPDFDLKFKIGTHNDRHRNIKTKRTTI